MFVNGERMARMVELSEFITNFLEVDKLDMHVILVIFIRTITPSPLHHERCVKCGNRLVLAMFSAPFREQHIVHMIGIKKGMSKLLIIFLSCEDQ